MRLTYNSSARILEHAAKQGRRVVLTTDTRSLLFPTPVGKSYYCPDETVVDMAESDTRSVPILHLRKLLFQEYHSLLEIKSNWLSSSSAY
jgi:hypothetical protein